MRTALDVAAVAVVAVMSGGAGWWAHVAVEERRMRRLVGSIHAALDERR